MERPLSVLVALVLMSFCEGWDAPGFCHGQTCPEYRLVQKTQDFEERLYVATSWITTTIKTNNGLGVMAANSKLKNYCKKHNHAGQDVPIRVDTWPALLTINQEGSLSWFIPPGTMPDITDESIRLETRPEATVYVRVFGGTPDLKSGNDAAKELRDALTKAGKTYDLLTFSGAAYDLYFSVDHHNEVWIYAV
ncbi:heme-binding protein soul2 [Pleuronectes platessa]|uniref:heme-binding protein soul2 n=1 Tax=Pleuronectes platessa TaxID=8262 RepID=UPI00232A2492|nr:heme-binding protein soul2 [Pleuronectes platessa]